MIRRGAYPGLTVVDPQGRVCGRIEGTYPLDGSTPEFAVVRLGRFGQRALVPVAAAHRAGELLLVPFGRADVEDAPGLDAVRYLDDAVARARGYWSTVRDERPARRRAQLVA